MFMPAVATPNAVARPNRRPRQPLRPGRRQAISKIAAPASRSSATAVGESRSNSPTASAAPMYMDSPPTTNRAGAGALAPMLLAVTGPRYGLQPWSLAVTNARQS
jgi:hypothetical protein